MPVIKKVTTNIKPDGSKVIRTETIDQDTGKILQTVITEHTPAPPIANPVATAPVEEKQSKGRSGRRVSGDDDDFEIFLPPNRSSTENIEAEKEPTQAIPLIEARTIEDPTENESSSSTRPCLIQLVVKKANATDDLGITFSYIPESQSYSIDIINSDGLLASSPLKKGDKVLALQGKDIAELAKENSSSVDRASFPLEFLKGQKVISILVNDYEGESMQMMTWVQAPQGAKSLVNVTHGENNNKLYIATASCSEQKLKIPTLRAGDCIVKINGVAASNKTIETKNRKHLSFVTEATDHLVYITRSDTNNVEILTQKEHRYENYNACDKCCLPIVGEPMTKHRFIFIGVFLLLMIIMIVMFVVFGDNDDSSSSSSYSSYSSNCGYKYCNRYVYDSFAGKYRYKYKYVYTCGGC